jgi:hypothetical protein
MNTQNYDKAVWMTVKEALELSGYGNSYLRMHLLKTGKVKSKKEPIGGTEIIRILIDRKSFMDHLKNSGKVDKNGKVTKKVTLTEEEYAKFQEYLKKSK